MQSPRRDARAKTLARIYTKTKRIHRLRQQRRLVRLRKRLREFGIHKHPLSSSPSSESTMSSMTSLSTLSEPSSDSELSDQSYISATSLDSFSSPEDYSSDSESAASGYIGGEDSDLESDLMELTDSQEEGNESEDPGESDDLHVRDRWASLRRWVYQEIHEMYGQRYEKSRNSNDLPRPPSFLHHVLLYFKQTRKDRFREHLRVSPLTFDAIVSAIEDDPVFHNNSNNGQMPVEEQLAITLFRFGHDGNAASLQKVADWAGVGKGTVLLVTCRVMTAVLRPSFMDKAVHFPTEEEKEKAKEWVEAHSCKAWRDGWCFVDGTLVPLAERPHWYGESYFDRKNRYSLNIQIVNLPNLRIVDFSYGHTGSTHDASAWTQTRLAKEHDHLMNEGEWVWADSAYPIDSWIIAPYKKPDRDLPENEIFNKHVLMVRIRSEHAIGFLKGRFHSLKNLRVAILDKTTHIIATYWIVACIGLHSFAMQCEERERANHDEPEIQDPFIAEGLSSSSDDDQIAYVPSSNTVLGARQRLEAARLCRETLKAQLFREKTRQMRQRARVRGGLDLYESDADEDMDL